MKSNWISRTIVAALAVTMLAQSSFAALSPAYEKGVDPNTPMGKELVDIVASYPNMAKISQEITGDQKFRVPFGPTYWRMLLQPNKIKILFIGQDGTHVAEAAGRTATAGFGGRAQDLAAYFGVRESAGFINAFGPTIYGQYGAFETPVFTDGGTKLRFSAAVDNQLWMMAQDPDSPLFQWRARLIEWIIRNNKDSLKMIVLFGGAARDTIGSLVEARGAKINGRTSLEQTKNMKVPLVELKSAGGNNEFPALLSKDGKDLYEQLVGSRLDYSKPEDVKKAQAAAKANVPAAFAKAAIVDGGLNGSGIVHPAQVGGYDLESMQVGAVKSISLKGLKLSDGSVIQNDVLIVQSPHPTALSMMTPPQASDTVGKALLPLNTFVKQGWKIQADAGQTSAFEATAACQISNEQNHTNKPCMGYQYRRTDIPPEYYDFGTPQNRMVSRSDASRLNAYVVVVGTRDRAPFDNAKMNAITKQAIPAGIAQANLFVTRPRTPDVRYVWDAGPGDEYAKLMKENLDMDAISKPKPGMTFEKNGIAAYNVKTHPENVGDFGHYRGTFVNPRVLVVADPDGVDDILTSRALTGSRGQFLQSVMDAAGVSDKYVLLKTVPFGMDGATAQEWAVVLQQTNKYREQVLSKIVNSNKLEAIIADGPFAAKEVARILGNAKVPVINVARTGTENDSGLAAAAQALAKVPSLSKAAYAGKMANIPRSHLTMLSRTWEGTGGSHVLDSNSPKYAGLAFAVIAPEWAAKQQMPLTAAEQAAVTKIKGRLAAAKLPAPGQKPVEFFSGRR